MYDLEAGDVWALLSVEEGGGVATLVMEDVDTGFSPSRGVGTGIARDELVEGNGE